MNTLSAEEANLEGIVHAEGEGGKIVIFKIKPGFDVINGIKKICKHYDIKAGVITSIFGSLAEVTLMVPMKNISFPVVKLHDPRVIVKENVNVAAGCGFVNTLEDGEITMHIHLTVFDGGLKGPAPEFSTVGGHMADYAPAPCLGTIEIAIQEVTGLKLLRKVDEDVGLPVTLPVKE